MEETTWFKINSPAVIFETMDNEVIIINLDIGYYYSVRGLGADIWMLINQDTSYEKIYSTIAAHFQQPLENIASYIQPFLDKLLKENLITQQSRPEKSNLDSIDAFHSNSTYETPILQKYDDMKNLLFLDPIHEVDEQGWPSQNVFEAAE
jgi:hypothetical protein